MKNLVFILVLLFSSLSFSQKVLTPKDFPVRIENDGQWLSFNNTNDLPIELSIYKISKNGRKEFIIKQKLVSNSEINLPSSKGGYMIKTIKDKKIYKNKFSIN